MSGVFRKASTLLNAFSCVKYPFLSPKCNSKIQVAGLITKFLSDKDYKRPPPFPYKERKYDAIQLHLDETMWRIDENSKLIVVDGPVASGKAKLAKEIAEQFDMLYIEHANLDYLWVNSYGYDFRMMKDKLPKHLQIFEIEDFLANPKERRSAELQYDLFKIRFKQYLDALNHILNTGQGVVMNRCVFSNMVFVDTFIKMGFVPKSYPKYHDQVWNCLKSELLRPHLVIYLDTPVETIRENLKKRNNPVEINSPVFQPEVLKELEQNYKFKYLQEISSHAELLVYDNSEGVDADLVVEDMERVNLDDYGLHDPKMEDWRFVDESHWSMKRIGFSRDRHQLEAWLTNIPAFDCEELIYKAEDMVLFKQVFESVPGNDTATGFNLKLGDSCIFKL